MLVAITLLVVILAGLGIFGIRSIALRYKVTAHNEPFIDEAIKFQTTQLVLAFIVLLITYLHAPANFTTFFQFGNLSAPASEIKWLGVAAGTTWLSLAASMGVWITLATSVFMYVQVKKAGASVNGIVKVLPWVILLSAMNAFSEEAVFRMGIISPLYGDMATPTLLMLSGVLFGLPHYFGQPSGIVGVIMAGFLGWLLAMSLVETQGLFLAWAIHFVQDVVIIGSLFVMRTKKSRVIAPS